MQFVCPTTIIDIYNMNNNNLNDENSSINQTRIIYMKRINRMMYIMTGIINNYLNVFIRITNPLASYWITLIGLQNIQSVIHYNI
jgi:hypothetical protein